VDQAVHALAVSGNDLHVGGSFSEAGGVVANAIARFDTVSQTWNSLGSGAANGVVNSLVTVAVSGNDVYVGGIFTEAGGALANYVARFDTVTQTWTSLGSGADNGVNSYVQVLAVFDGNVYVGGSFTQAGGAEANRVARFDTVTQTWSSLGIGLANGVNGSVSELAVSGSDMYVGGVFTQAGQAKANRVARFNTVTQSWSALGSGAANGIGGRFTPRPWPCLAAMCMWAGTSPRREGA
jgi:hypothetical protein